MKFNYFTSWWQPYISATHRSGWCLPSLSTCVLLSIFFLFFLCRLFCFVSSSLSHSCFLLRHCIYCEHTWTALLFLAESQWSVGHYRSFSWHALWSLVFIYTILILVATFSRYPGFYFNFNLFFSKFIHLCVIYLDHIATTHMIHHHLSLWTSCSSFIIFN